MKLSIAISILREVLERVAPIIPLRPTFPVLQNISFEVQKNSFSIYATDLDIWIKVIKTFQKENETEAGRVIVPGRKLLETLQEITDPIIRLRTEDNLFLVETEKGYFKYLTVPIEEYPELQSSPEEYKFELDNKLLIEMFNATSFACAKELQRPAISGVLWEIRESEIRFVATDAYRFAFIKKEGVGVKEKIPQLIIPKKVSELLDKEAEKVNIFCDSSRAAFEYTFEDGHYWFMTRLIEGPYPEYERVIPLKHPNRFTANKESFVKSLRRVAVFSRSDDKTRMVILELSPEKKIIFSESPDIGEGREEIFGEYEGEKLKIAFNALYLLEILNHTKSENVVMEFGLPNQAMKIKPEAVQEQEEILYLLMPMHYEE